ncbi:hypothetical protein BJV82DRAFT_260661 [Fennellomyces sp. T-0311]|nr:hypothetical protein BJV82DRAFT_260661 [Fennellomyces sp. T-0311]
MFRNFLFLLNEKLSRRMHLCAGEEHDIVPPVFKEPLPVCAMREKECKTQRWLSVTQSFFLHDPLLPCGREIILAAVRFLLVPSILCEY